MGGPICLMPSGPETACTSQCSCQNSNMASPAAQAAGPCGPQNLTQGVQPQTSSTTPSEAWPSSNFTELRVGTDVMIGYGTLKNGLRGGLRGP